MTAHPHTTCTSPQELEQLRCSEARFRALVEGSGDCALIADEQGRLLYTSPALRDRFGYLPTDVEGRLGFEFVHPDDVPRARQLLHDALAAEGPVAPVELRLRTADGRWLWTEETVVNRLDDPYVRGLIIGLRDVSVRKQATEELAASEARYRAIVESAQEGIWMLDAQDATSFVNPRLEEMLERPAAELMGRGPGEFVHPDDAHLLQERCGRRRQGLRERFQCRFVSGTGRVLHLLVSGHPFQSADGSYSGTLGLLTDVTDLVLAQERLSRLAVRDELTGLPNRTLLLEQLATAVESQGRTGGTTAVVYLDLNRDLAAVHDRFGHAPGDRFLVETAQRLLREVRPGDVVGRWQDDVLVVVAPGMADRAAGEQLAEQLRVAAGRSHLVEGHSLVPSPGIGVAFGPADPVELLRNAGVAAHRAADSPGRVLTFSPQLHLAARNDLELVEDLRRALLAEDQLELHYQPVVALADQRAVGAEVLVRWRHPQRGLLAPDTFIGLAESVGLVRDLDRAVLRQACRTLAGWRETGAVADDFTLAVNISGSHCVDESLVDHVRQVLADTGLPPRNLVLEVTETSVVTDVAAASLVLNRLRNVGVGLSIDDFGTGYCSLTYLRRFPVHALKIDREFVQGMVESYDDAAIVAATLGLARSVGMTCIAEGVETADQLAALREQGCALAQGYLWSPPVPADRLPEALELRRVPLPAPQRSEPEADPEVAHVVLELHATGASEQSIASALNRAGRHTHNGRRWHAASVRRVLALALAC